MMDPEDEVRPSTIVYVDQNLNGVLDSKTLTGSGEDDEPFAVSGTDGKYTLTDLSAGDTIRGESPGIPRVASTLTEFPLRKAQRLTQPEADAIEPDARPPIGAPHQALSAPSCAAYDAEHVELDWVTDAFPDERDEVFNHAWWLTE